MTSFLVTILRHRKIARLVEGPRIARLLVERVCCRQTSPSARFQLLSILGPVIMRVRGNSLGFLEGRRRALASTPLAPRPEPRTPRARDPPARCAVVAGYSPAFTFRSFPVPPPDLRP